MEFFSGGWSASPTPAPGPHDAARAQQEYESQLAEVQRVERSRVDAVAYIDAVLEHMDLELATLSPVVLLRAALKWAEQEAKEERASEKADKHAKVTNMKAAKKASGEGAATSVAKDGDLEAEEAAREAAQAAEHAEALAARAEKLAGGRAPTRLSQLRRWSQQQALAEAEGLMEDPGTERASLHASVKTTKAARAVKAETRAAGKDEGSKSSGGGGGQADDEAGEAEVDDDDEEEEDVGTTARQAKAAERWLQPWRGNGVVGGGGRREFEVPEMNVAFRSCDCLAMDSSGDRMVAVAPDGRSATLLSVSSGKALRTFAGHGELCCCVAIRGDVVASAGRDRTIRLWSARSGQSMGTLDGCTDNVYGLAMAGGRLLSGEGSGKRGRVRIWSVRRQEQIEGVAYSAHGGPVWSVALVAGRQAAATGREVALSASSDGSARVWPVQSPPRTCASTRDVEDEVEGAGAGAGVGTSERLLEPLGVLPHPAGVFSCSAEGELAATACGDKCARLWSLSTFECVRVLQHDAPGISVAILSVRLRGGVLASGGEDKVVKLWPATEEHGNLASMECVATLAHGDTVRGIAISSKGFVASIGGDAKKLVVWRAAVAAPGDLTSKLLGRGKRK